MRKEKSPGLKILWLWTIGTAAILVTSVVRTRLRDVENHMNAEQQPQQQHAASATIDLPLVDTLPPSSDHVIPEDKD